MPLTHKLFLLSSLVWATSVSVAQSMQDGQHWEGVAAPGDASLSTPVGDLRRALPGTEAVPHRVPQVVPEPLGTGKSLKELSSLLNDVFYHVDREGVHWVRSPGYKANVSHRGLSYRPYLGPAAERFYPIRLSLEEVAVAGRALNLQGRPTIRRDGDRITLTRPGVLEQYDFGLRSVEQSFVLPAGTRGDVRVSVSLDVDESFTWNADDRMWTHELGHVSLSEAVAFAHDGRSISIPCRVEKSRMIMSVPAAFIESTNGPVTIDPVLSSSSFSLGNETFVPLDSACYEPSTNRYALLLYLYREPSDWDVLSVLVDGDTGEVSTPMFLEMSDQVVGSATVGAHTASRRFMYLLFEREGFDDVIVSLIPQRSVDGTFLPAVEVERGPISRTRGYWLGSDPYPTVNSDFLLMSMERSAPFSGDYTCFTELRDFNGHVASPRRAVAAGTDRFSGGRLTKTNGSPDLATQWTFAWTTGTDRLKTVTVNYNGTAATSVRSVPMPFEELVSISNPSGQIDPVTGKQVLLLTGSDSEYRYQVAAMAGQRWLSEPERMMESFSVVHGLEANPVEHSFSTLDVAALSDGFAVLTRPDVFLAETTLTSIRTLENSFGAAVVPERLGETALSSLTTTYEWGGAAGRRAFALDLDFTDHPKNPEMIATPTILEVPADPAAGHPIGRQRCRGDLNSTESVGYLSAHGNRTTSGIKTLVLGQLPAGEWGRMLFGLNGVDAADVGPGNLCLGTGFNYMRSLVNTGDGAVEVTFDASDLELNFGSLSAVVGDVYNFQFWYQDSGTIRLTNAVGIVIATEPRSISPPFPVGDSTRRSGIRGTGGRAWWAELAQP